MPQRSKIEQLPPELLEQVNRLLEKATIEQVVDQMKQLGVQLSSSAVGRHKKKIEEVARHLRDSRVIAEAIGKRIEDQPDDRMAALTIELLHGQIMRLAMASEDGEPVKLEIKEILALAESLRSLASANKTNADRALKVRKEAVEKALKAADEQMKNAGQPGMSAETVDNIKRKILGLT